jgi:hypothetical protein
MYCAARPRAAFIEDSCTEIEVAMQEGDNIVLMLDNNEDM